MGYVLREDVYLCIANAQVVLLDLASGRYSALPGLADLAMQALLARKCLTDGEAEALRALANNGVLMETEGPHAISCCEPLPPPVRDMSGTTRLGADTVQVARAMTSHLVAAVELHRRPLREIVKGLRADTDCRAKDGCEAQACISQINAFLVTRRLITAQDRCLKWSLAMIKYLKHERLYPSLVIGVRMKPFGAHAWVQQGETVLSDTVDNVRPYTPILIV